MPPRKRARLSEAASPNAASPGSAPDTSGKPTDEDILNDPWTDEEEIGLFKGLVKWKPTGIHKHFRMLQLHDYLLDNSYIHPRSEHTKIPGLWQKLASLYDLEALDQREDARQLSDVSDDEANGSDKDADEEDEEDENDDVYSLAANKVHNELFELPEDEFGEEMWQQRFVKEDEKEDTRDESPLALPNLNLASDAPVRFTPTIEIVPEEIEPPTTKRRGRPSKASATTATTAAATATRTSKPTASAGKRRSRRGASSVEAESDGQASGDEHQHDGEEVQEEEEEEEQEEGDDGEEEGEGGDEDEEEEQEESSEAGTSTTTRSKAARTRSRSTAKGRPRGRRR